VFGRWVIRRWEFGRTHASGEDLINWLEIVRSIYVICKCGDGEKKMKAESKNIHVCSGFLQVCGNSRLIVRVCFIVYL
jgi:hypothetical protein